MPRGGGKRPAAPPPLYPPLDLSRAGGVVPWSVVTHEASYHA